MLIQSVSSMQMFPFSQFTQYNTDIMSLSIHIVEVNGVHSNIFQNIIFSHTSLEIMTALSFMGGLFLQFTNSKINSATRGRYLIEEVDI